MIALAHRSRGGPRWVTTHGQNGNINSSYVNTTQGLLHLFHHRNLVSSGAADKMPQNKNETCSNNINRYFHKNIKNDK